MFMQVSCSFPMIGCVGCGALYFMLPALNFLCMQLWTKILIQLVTCSLFLLVWSHGGRRLKSDGRREGRGKLFLAHVSCHL